MSQPYQPITVEELERRRAAGWEPFVLDVRGPGEAAVASLSFTDRLEPHVSVTRIAGELPTDRDIVVYCRSGGRSAMACMMLAQMGVRNLYNLEGGINAWAMQIDPSLQIY
ncbi:MAG: sulfurtransferase [Alphaproteobacteria bacterium]|nr:sulfurtransferase [Alphaproteobacteria bacterium]